MSFYEPGFIYKSPQYGVFAVQITKDPDYFYHHHFDPVYRGNGWLTNIYRADMKWLSCDKKLGKITPLILLLLMS